MQTLQKHNITGTIRRSAALKLLVAALLFAALTVHLPAQTAYADVPAVDAKAYIVIDANTGEALYEVNSNQVLVPASLTKLMTAYLVLDGITERRISWGDKVTISEYSNRISRQTSLSSFRLPTGAKYTVEELFYAITLNSSNAGSIAIAEHIGGGSEGALSA